jgi:hypothetical protein
MIEDFINARLGAAAADFIARVKGDIPSLVFLKTPALLSAACMIYSRGTDIDDAVIDKLAAKGLFLTGKPHQSKALLEFLLYIYAEIKQKNAQTFENRCVHQVLSSF